MIPLPSLMKAETESAEAGTRARDERQAPLFVLHDPQYQLETQGCLARLPSGATASLGRRVKEFFAASRSGPGLLVGALPFDPHAADALYQPARLISPEAPAISSQTQLPSLIGDSAAEPAADQYNEMVARCVSQLCDDNATLGKAVLARSLRLQAADTIDPLALAKRLERDASVTTYVAPLPVKEHEKPAWLVGATPELLVSVRGSTVISHPLAGSASRHKDAVEDARSGEQLAASGKDLDEHRFVVDAIVAALAPLCSELDAPDTPSLHSTDTMWHLGTRIVGTLKDPETSAATLAGLLHPTPAVCGTPRELALDTIRKLEPVDRGFYAGAVGWVDAQGDGDWYVAIRCARVQADTLRLFAGAGIVADSVPALEVLETTAKFSALLNAFGVEDTGSSQSRLPLRQVWPGALVERYRAAGHWRGETFPAFLRDRAACFSDDIAVVAGDSRYTYADLGREAERIGAGLLALGLVPGDRVIVQFGNVAEFIPVVCGLFYAGLIPVYALPAHRITEITHFARKAQASAYIAGQHYAGFDYSTLARELCIAVPEIAHVIIAEDGEAQEYTALSTLCGNPETLPKDPDPQAVAFLQISGGSTGLSKLIPRTHDDYIYSFRASNELCNITRQSVYMVALPAAHNFPMSSPGWLGALYAGARVVLSPGAEPGAAFALIEQERVTCVGLVPPLALLWADAAVHTEQDISSLEVMQVGGAKLVPEAARRLINGLDCKLQQVFGMAEGLVNYTRLDDPDEVVLMTQGRPISPDDDIRVVDDNDQPVVDGEAGHLQVSGPYTIRGYHNDETANSRSFTADGYYCTGDIVKRTPDGNLIVQGRANDHINRAGEKISAEEIEDHLLGHPAVFDAAVVSIPDDYLGERSCAFIIARGDRPRAVALKKWMREQGLAAFKVPDQIVFANAFDTTAVGKVSRRELRAQLRQRFLEQESN